MRHGSGKGLAVGAALLTLSLSACIAPDVEVIGALGVTVDEDARPVLVLEACDGAAAEVSLFLDRQGMSDDEENEVVGKWTASAPVAGTSELELHAPAGPWQGEGVAVPLDRGVIATAGGEGEREVLSQVAFHRTALAEMKPGTVYRNDPDPDVTDMVGLEPAAFTAEVCGRG